MKRTLVSLLSLLALLSLYTLTSCQKEATGDGMQFRATMECYSATISKTFLVGTSLNWVNGDQVAIYGTAGCGIYSATPQCPATVAVFDNLSGETGNGPFRAFYPSTLTTDGVNITLPDTQIYVEGSIHEFPMYAESTTNQLGFKNLCGVLKLHLTRSNTSISTIAVTTNTEANGTYRVGYASGNPVLEYVAGGTNTTTLTCATAQPIDNGKTFYIYLPATVDSVKSIELNTNDGRYCIKTVKATSHIGIERNTITEITLGESDMEFIAPDWVDLGLPSGLLWATRNVGATNPEDYGNYYAWGETSPKNEYHWRTYRYCNYFWWADDFTLTKYMGRDLLFTLQPTDDAATANYGGRTPTKDEWQELVNNTMVQITTQNGVYGRLFTGTNGNSIFLPTAGYRMGYTTGLGGDGNGYYWSSSLTGYPREAWCFYFYYGGQYMDAHYRFLGYSVRAVRSAQ